MKKIQEIFQLLQQHEDQFKNSFYMVPSENSISSLAKVPFRTDAYNRYFFKEDSIWGVWAFHGGKHIGQIELEILIPLLKRLCKAEYVNVKPISGLSCMTVTLASYCKQGDDVFILHGEMGGHASTQTVAETLGYNVHLIPYLSFDKIDYQVFSEQLSRIKPRLVYIDQANVLFPIDIKELSRYVKEASSDTKIHYDTSHLNGLVLGKALPNPLENGADSFGGSTHKTLPGPHKAFWVTNDSILYDGFEKKAAHMISHTHMADTIALTLILLEFEEMGGSEYAGQVIKNAKSFAKAMDKQGLVPVGKHKGYTASHQVWLDPSNYASASYLTDKLFEGGLIVNAFNKLPTISGEAFRIALNEVTRLGLMEDDVCRIAEFFGRIIVRKEDPKKVFQDVKAFRHLFNESKFCFSETQVHDLFNATFVKQ